MKKLTDVMVKLFLTFGLCWIFFNSNSQEAKLNKQEQKEARKTIMVENYHILDSLLTGRKFVLNADYLSNQYGARIYVLSSLNFIKVDSPNVVIQTGTYSGLGYNGVGGITAEGQMEGWKLIKNAKKLSYNIQFSVVSNIGAYDVFMTVNADNYVRATVSGLRPGQLTYEGHLQTINNSSIFKGQIF